MIHKIKIHIPEDVKTILNILKSNGYKAYIVGGCVRDSLLNREPKDWDIATNATPVGVMNLFDDLKYKVIETGLKHGTVTIMINNIGYEVTTFRIDGIYEDNRHPKEVIFTDSLRQDLSRRDFTINAMAYDDDFGLVDYFGGIKDLNNKIIKCVGNPSDRFSEDALRILRACRFASQLKFGHIDGFTADAMMDNYKSIEFVSKERISAELNKILLSGNIYGLYFMIQSRIIEIVLPELIECFSCKQDNPYHDYNVGMHIFTSTEAIESKLHLKLTMLLHDICKPQCKTIDENGIGHFYGHSELSSVKAKEILQRLKYDNNTINKVETLIKYHDREIGSKKSIRKLLNIIGEDLFRDLLKVKEADIKAQNIIYFKDRFIKLLKIEKDLNEILTRNECFTIKDLKINGKDLLRLGYKQGKEIGEKLNCLLELVLESPELNDREYLINLVKKL